jgi:cysteate synthase
LGGSGERFRDAIAYVHADELTNWAPPYEVRGGIYDSLLDSRGDVLAADNQSVRAAVDMFLELEGIDIEPAAGVAVACLWAAAKQGRVTRNAVVLLNVTGGGRLRLRQHYPLMTAVPQLRLTRKSLDSGEAVDRIAALCSTLQAT